MKRSSALSSMTSSRGSFEIDEAQFEVMTQGSQQHCEWSDIDLELERLSNPMVSTMVVHVEPAGDTLDMAWSPSLHSSVIIEEICDLPPGTGVMHAVADSRVAPEVVGRLAQHANEDAIRRMQTPVPVAAVGWLAKQLPVQKRNSKPRKTKPPKKVTAMKATAVATPAAPKVTKPRTARASEPTRCMPGDCKSLHHFQSRRFQAAARRAATMGLSDEDSKALRRDAYKEATVEWNKFYNA